jgi:hypothetical protein
MTTTRDSESSDQQAVTPGSLTRRVGLHGLGWRDDGPLPLSNRPNMEPAFRLRARRITFQLKISIINSCLVPIDSSPSACCWSRCRSFPGAMH